MLTLSLLTEQVRERSKGGREGEEGEIRGKLVEMMGAREEEDYRSTDHLLYHEYMLILSLLAEWTEEYIWEGEMCGCMEREAAREEWMEGEEMS